MKIISFQSAREWEKWLAKNHAASQGVWLKIFKKGSGTPSIHYPEALEGALCYGWIDGQKAAHDEKAWLQRFSPRRAKSAWSKINVGRAKRLIQAGRMKPAGLRQIEAAQKDGRWSRAYHPPSAAKWPEDFLRELGKNPKAKAFLETLNRQNAYAIVYRLQTAKKAETRQKRIKQFVEMLSKGEKLHP
ncbi:MAG TPA: YdeI/OmpD-associated family protein [bacterium]|nr:YdeI/OmpD-associated family protein [bacterium]